MLVRTSKQLAWYPYAHLEEDAREAIAAAALLLPKTANIQGLPSLLKVFECYLAVTSERLSASRLKSNASRKICMGFVGALTEETLIGWTPITRESHIRLFRAIIGILRPSWATDTPELCNLEECLRVWNMTPLDSEAVEYWSGWWVSGQNGKSGFLNLTGAWNKFGAEFCRGTHQALSSYWAGRANSLSNSSSLFQAFFAHATSGRWQSTPKNPFLDGQEFSKLVRSFCEDFFVSAHQKSLCLTTSRKRWNDWRNVVIDALINPGVWPTPSEMVPLAGDYQTPGHSTHIRKTAEGMEVREKFLTKIPLDISDDEAIETLISSISLDKDSVVAWSTFESNKLIAKCIERGANAPKGTDLLVQGRFVGNRIHASSHDLAATFAAHSFAMFEEQANLSAITNLRASEIGTALGIPMSGDLDPFMYLLINQHPEITDAFLRGLKVENSIGQDIGVIKSDDGYTLVGEKRRRGSALAEQRILLNQESQKILEDILLVTRPLREWMREKDDADWVYLFLSCAKGLSKPSMVKHRAANNTGASERLIAGLAQHTKRTGPDLQSFYKQISLTAFRSSRALADFFLTGDEKTLAKSLGHRRQKPQLLSHYLPDSIQMYFKSRSIRQMQNLIIATAMEGSENIVRATDFATMNALNTFLVQNTLSGFDTLKEEPTDRSDARVYLDVGEATLTILAAILRDSRICPGKLNKEAKRWADYAELLFPEIERVQHDTRLQERYQRALKGSVAVEIQNLIRVAET